MTDNKVKVRLKVRQFKIPKENTKILHDHKKCHIVYLNDDEYVYVMKKSLKTKAEWDYRVWGVKQHHKLHIHKGTNHNYGRLTNVDEQIAPIYEEEKTLLIESIVPYWQAKKYNYNIIEDYIN